MNWLDDFGLVGLFDLLDIRVWLWPSDLIAEFGLMSCEVSWWVGRGNSDGEDCIVVVNLKKPDYDTLLGGGKTPSEQWEVHQNELNDLDADSQEAMHNQLLIDKSGRVQNLLFDTSGQPSLVRKYLEKAG
jgi:hypothetical protein